MSSIDTCYIVKNWLAESRIDLECANLLYRNKIFSRALYHLQRSNEKLAKGHLTHIGFLTPKMARKDLAIIVCFNSWMLILSLCRIYGLGGFYKAF